MNLPNTITMIRIALVPVFMVVALSNIPNHDFIATVIFAIASITDGLDGHIARKYNLVTNFGKFVDPLADKLLVTAALLIFCETGIMPAWAVMLIIISSLRMLAAARGRVIQAVFSGKLKTTVHIICIILLMLNILPAAMQTFAVWVMVIMSVYSCVDYMMKNIDILKDNIKDGGKK